MLATLLLSAHPAAASDAQQTPDDERCVPGTLRCVTPPPRAASERTIPATPAVPNGAAPGGGAIQQIFHILKFPYETFKEATIRVALSVVSDAFEQAERIYGRAMEGLIFSRHGIAPREIGARTTPLYEELVLPHWRVTFGLALALLPATLALTAVSVMRSGVASVLSYAELKESLLGWVIAAGAAAASFYLLGLAHRLSLFAARSVLLSSFTGAPVNAASIANAFLNAAAFAAVNWLFPSVALYVGFLLLFLGTAVIFGLALALAAYTALAYILGVIAPLVIVVGALPPLRWLHFLWLKAVTVTFLVPLANALILKAAISAAGQVAGNNLIADPTPLISGFFVTAGMVSLLIAINYKVGEFVFGVLGEVHRRALDSTRQVLGLAALATGAVAGAAVVGGAGAAAAGGTGSSGAAAATGGPGSNGAAASGPATGGGLPSGANGLSQSPAERLAGDPQLRQRIGQLVARGGHALALGTRSPLLRGLGLGASVGGEYGAGGARLDSVHAREAAAAQREAERTYDRSLDRAQRSRGGPGHGLASAPPELGRPGYDPSGLLERHLRRSVPEADPAAARRLNAGLNTALRRAGAAADADALKAARLDLYTAYGSGHTAPEAFAQHLAHWGREHGVALPEGWRADVAAMYPPGSAALGQTDLGSRIQAHLDASRADGEGGTTHG